MIDEFHTIIKNLLNSEDYIKISELKDGYSYKIFARNAFVGIWIEKENGFLISRYKTTPKPYFFYEYHWDYDDVIGTVKPLAEIEKCSYSTIFDDKNNKQLLNYLDRLEENNPILPGYNTLKIRKEGAIKFGKRLSGKIEVKGKPKIHELIKSGVIKID